MKKLLIDTSTQALIIILSDDNKVIDSIFELVIRDHSSKLMPNIDLLLQRNHQDIQEIKEIIVTEGPGSYTGCRIGITVAKTLSYSLNIPIKKVSTLKLMSASYMNDVKYIAPIIDARRGNVFAGLYEVNQHKLVNRLEDKLYSYSAFIEKITEMVNEKILIVGLNLNAFQIKHDFLSYNDEYKMHFNPQLIMNLDFESVENIHQLIPNYKRLTEAELNLK